MVSDPKVEAFLVDLLSVYQKHGLRVGGMCCSGPRIVPLNVTPETVRDRTRFPEGADEGDDECFESGVYVEVSEAELEIDRIRKGSDQPYRYIEY